MMAPAVIDVASARGRIAAAVEALIDLLDVLDGNPDIEANGDELDEACCSWSRLGLGHEDDEYDCRNLAPVLSIGQAKARGGG